MFHVVKAQGSTRVKDYNNNFSTVVAYVGFDGSDQLCLKDIMNLHKVNIHKAIELCEAHKAVLIGDKFDIGFFDVADAQKFVNTVENV